LYFSILVFDSILVETEPDVLSQAEDLEGPFEVQTV